MIYQASSFKVGDPLHPPHQSPWMLEASCDHSPWYQITKPPMWIFWGERLPPIYLYLPGEAWFIINLENAFFCHNPVKYQYGLKRLTPTCQGWGLIRGGLINNFWLWGWWLNYSRMYDSLNSRVSDKLFRICQFSCTCQLFGPLVRVLIIFFI